MGVSVGSLFAGIGGFDLAAERAGMTVSWQAEIDPHASRVLAHHWPHIPNLGDVTHADPPPTDILVGGFPCQDYSVAGIRRGLAGDRGALWWQFHRIIAGVRPTWIVGENVPGLLSSRGGRDFATIVDSLVELGYGVVWRVLDAQWFGVAQRRRRVFIVGHSGGEPRPEVLALGQSVSGDTPPSRKPRTGTTAGVSPSLKASGKQDHVGVATGFAWQAGGDQSSSGAVIEELSPTFQVSQTMAVAFSAGNSGDSFGVGYSGEHSPPLRASASGTNQVPTVAFAQNQRDEIRDLGDKVGSLAAEPGIHQQTYVVQGAGSSSQNTDRSRVRRLTPLECERLQGFPDGWTDIPGNSDTQRYRQLGNAVAVPVVEWIMRRV